MAQKVQSVPREVENLLKKKKVEAPAPPTKEANSQVVYRRVMNKPYVGRFLTLTIESLNESYTLEENEPQEFPISVCTALVALSADFYTIEQA